jgi:hypothetical protein
MEGGEKRLQDRERKRRAIYHAYLWIGFTGIIPFVMYIALGGRPPLP